MPTGLTRSIPDVIKAALASRLADHHNALPGKVVSYDASTNLADVQVMVKQAVFDDDVELTSYEDLGVLIGVPVKMPRAGGFLISLPIAAGDEGELVFHSTAIGEWRQSGQVSEPVDVSRHSIGWPTFRPDLFNDNNPISSSDLSNREAGIVIGKEGGDEQILIQSGAIVLGKSATDFVALAAKVLTELGKIQTAHNGHVHLLTLSSGTGTAAPPAITYSPSSVAGALVKAK